MKKFKIVLASASPRRKDILEKMGLEFEIIPSSYDEFLESSDFAYEKIEDLAYNKAKAVADKMPLSPSTVPISLVLSADTVVVLENQILGKPKDKADAFFMLKKLSGKKHSVVTSICVINSKSFEQQILSTTSYVEFEYLNDELILHYIENYNPLDKAGSYGIQELPQGFIKNVEGSFENIMGLCPLAVTQVLQIK